MFVTAFRYTLQDNEQEIEVSAAGDAKIFERVFKLYYSKLTFFANRFLNDLEASEEVVSDTFTYLWEHRNEISISTSKTAYIYKMVQNRCVNYLKHKKIENEYVDYLKRNDLLSEFSDSIIDFYNKKELEIEIKKAINDLPEKCRAIFKLSRFEHLKNREIAEQLHISQKTVERHMTIALERMRKYLQHLFIFLSVFLIG